MSKHTPGPWHVANGKQIRSKKDQIALTWMMRAGEGNANARLIAAAPDLLEALKAYEAWAHKTLCYDRELRPIRAQIRAAIAKAEGEQE